MEPIKPEFAWQPCCYGDALPHAQLIFAIITQAWFDANKRFKCPVREKARAWFYSSQFKEFCELLGLNREIYLDCIKNKWRKA